MKMTGGSDSLGQNEPEPPFSYYYTILYLSLDKALFSNLGNERGFFFIYQLHEEQNQLLAEVLSDVDWLKIHFSWNHLR